MGAAYTVQIRQRGVLTIPNEVRRRYGLDEDDILTLVDLGDALLLTPKLSIVPKLAREIEKKRQRAGVSLEELIEAVQRDRATASDNSTVPDNVSIHG